MTEVPGGDSSLLAGRLKGWLSAARANLSDRTNLLVSSGILTIAFMIWGGLTVRAGLVGFGALTAWSALRPFLTASSALAEFEARRQASEAARVAGARVWTDIVACLPDPTLILDAEGTILAFNSAAVEIFGGSDVGRHISQMTRAPELLSAVDGALETHDVQSCRLDFKVPVERSLVGTVAPLNVANREAQDPHLLIVLRDLTEQDRLVRMRADFVANASHELRTPLASLKGFVETLQDAAKDDPDARERFLKIMQQQAERMARLIDDLLSLSRIEMRAHVVPRERVDVASLVTHVAQTLTPIAQDKSITLDVQNIPQSVVSGDRDELIQVFQNLIENAIKYGRIGGRVSVSGKIIAASPSVRGEKLAIEIVDDGPGIAPDHLPRLTERFYRVNAAQSRHAGGTGLGLAIVKHVLNRHQGDLQVDSVVGRGSTFRVILPTRGR
ncbi:MAG TPA: phosphate regulon sensor histidine kinase PhoR [Hyphomicrobium sp.]|nr:phosphate regulon sensor histidine kinase PhoR [Hyphomicrobium sp.]